jgi:hypothetical protein
MSTLLLCALTTSGLYAGDSPRVAFVTTVNGTGNLSTWPDANGAEGLEAADEICANRALAAGLENPTNFVAWISDSSSDAYCRVHGFFGTTKAANCGQAQLPEAAGPWVRTDGTPFAPVIEELALLMGAVYTSLKFDEFGNPLPLDTEVWSATHPNGSLLGITCEDWSSATPIENARTGQVDRTSQSWTAWGSVPCSFPDLHLYCLETEPGPALNLPVATERFAFTTNEQDNGDLSTWAGADPGTSGIEAGDSICNNDAEQAGLPNVGSYKAWLSDDSVDARDRFENDGPWFRPDGFRIARNMADLIDGELFTSNSLLANGVHRGNFHLWSGTNADGTSSGDDCGNWETTAADGSGGRVNAVSENWTAGETFDCNSNNAKLYCLSDAPVENLHKHGFERHDR